MLIVVHGSQNPVVQCRELEKRKCPKKLQLLNAYSASSFTLADIQSMEIHSVDDCDKAAAEVGFPMVLKPPAGMGAKATFRVTNEESLLRAVSGMAVSAH